MAAAPGIDDARAARQPREVGGMEDARRLGGQRQQADEDLAAREQRREPRRPGISHEPGDVPRAAAPAGNIKAERLELSARVLAERAEAKDAHRSLGGVLLVAFTPERVALLRQVVEILAVQTQ